MVFKFIILLNCVFQNLEIEYIGERGPMEKYIVQAKRMEELEKLAQKRKADESANQISGRLIPNDEVFLREVLGIDLADTLLAKKSKKSVSDKNEGQMEGPVAQPLPTVGNFEIIGRPKYLNYSRMDVLYGIKQGVINKIREWQLNNIALEVTYIVDFHSSNYYSLLQYNETKLVAEVPEIVKDLRTAYRYVEGAKGQRTKQSIALPKERQREMFEKI